MKKTYTYTARNAADPAHVITFTLYEQQLAIEAGPQDHLDRLPYVTHGTTHDDLEMLKLFTDSMPVMELIDVAVHLERDRLRVMGWGQLPDRQWRPLTLSVEHVDNLPAARAFIRELNRRKMAALRRERLQKWAAPRLTWFAGGIAAVLFTAVALRLRSN